MGDYDGDERRKEMKEATKEALKEWLDERFNQAMASLGKRALVGFAAVVFAALVYFILWANGWHK